MSDDRKGQALAAWHKLLDEPEIRMDVEDQYDELLKMADTMEQEGMITAVEWRQLVRTAGEMFAQATEGLEGGT
jgi:hypothetical protein